MNNKTKIKKSDVVIIIILSICIITAAVAMYMYYSVSKDYEKSDVLYENTVTDYTVRNGDMSAPWYEMLGVNMKGLKEKNDEIIGWLFFENEDISYPILKSADNEKYYRTAYDNTEASAGSIFMESINSSDFSDLHTIIYGHNMKNLSMFGRLKYYKENDNYYDSHKYFQIILPDRKFRYEVIAYKDVDAEGDFYTIYKKDSKDFKRFIDDKILRDSLVNSNVELNDDSQIVSLSTCTASDVKRFAVSATKIDEREMDSYYIPVRVKETQSHSNNVNYLFLILGSIFILVDIGAIIWIVVKSKRG